MGKTLKISKPLLLLIITEKKLIFDICDTHQHTKTRNTHTKKSSAHTGGDQHLGRVEGRGLPRAHKNKKITHKKRSARTGGDKTTQNTKIQKLFSFIKVHFRI